MNCVRARIDSRSGVFGRILDGNPTLNAVFVAVQAHDDRELWSTPVTNRSDDISEESGPSLTRAPVDIVTAVPSWRQERRKEVTVGRVDFNPVKSGLLDSSGSGGEVSDDIRELCCCRFSVGGHLPSGKGRHLQQLFHGCVRHHSPGVRRRWRQ